MLDYLILYIVCYTSVLSVVVTLGYFRQIHKERIYSLDSEKIDLTKAIVLIPFRNEEHRILDLINSINASNDHPSEYLFIDDHSTDKTIQVINNNLEIVNYKIIELPLEFSGKKKALRYATDMIDCEFVLTMDADIEFEKDYFLRLSQLGSSEMYLLPVIMQPHKWYEYFFEIDLILVNAVNMSLAGLKRPIIASGANLLYKKKTFDRVDNIQSHEHMASGDDTYLLRDFRDSGSEVRLVSNPELAITTETPQSVREFIDQRIRWISKTTDIKDSLSTTIAVFQSILTLGFLALIIILMVRQEFLLVGILLVLKTLVDMTVFLPYFFRMKRYVSWAFTPLYELFFPIYTLVILVLMFTYTPKWKGRKIYQSK